MRQREWPSSPRATSVRPLRGAVRVLGQVAGDDAAAPYGALQAAQAGLLRGHRRVRAGFTLVEMLVAVVILAIGLLGLVSSAAVVTRQVGGGTNQTVAAQTIANRLEKLRSLGCSQIANASETSRGVYEHWVPGATVNGVLFVVDTVKYSIAGTEKKETYTITVPCQ